MKVKILSPTKAYIMQASNEEMESLADQLTYIDLAVKYELKRLSQNLWYRNSNPIKWQLQCDSLKVKLKQTLIFDENGIKYIRPGSLPYLTGLSVDVDNQVIYPTPKKIPWQKPLPFTLYDFQGLSVEKLIDGKHDNVELCTGAGKSAIILSVCRETGFRCAIVAPSKGIFNELVEKFEYHLGKGNVGKFGDGKKKIGKRITICIGDSLCNLKRGTEEWDFFSKLDMIVCDESHTLPAETLEQVCHGVFSEVPYRLFLSGTQTRNDGGVKLLQSIVGETVHSLTTQEAVGAGFICPHDYRIVSIQSSDPSFTDTDPLETKRIHFLRNHNIAAFIAKFSTIMAEKGNQTLILVEELNQIAMLKKLLTIPFGYAHSETKKERLLELGLEKVNVAEQIERFNRNEFKVFAGTSCLHVGVNIYPMRNTFNWIGGSSEIKTKQGPVGRSIRLASANPYASKCDKKDICTIWDFNVINNDTLERHLRKRIECYADSGPGLIKFVKLK